MYWHVSPWIYPLWDSLPFLDFIDYFLCHIREVFNYNLFKYFLRPFFYYSSSGTPIIRMLVHLMLSQRSLRLLNSFHSFFFILLCGRYFHYFILQVTYPSSASVILLLIPSREFVISFIVLFIIVYLLFSSSRSLLNGPCIFSILFPRFWITFTIITLNSFSGRLPISSSFVWSDGFLPCSFICSVLFWLLLLLNLLCLGYPFHRLQVHNSRCFWCLPPVGKVASVGCVGLLVEGTGARVLLDEVGSCLSGGQDCIQRCVLGCL